MKRRGPAHDLVLSQKRFCSPAEMVLKQQLPSIKHHWLILHLNILFLPVLILMFYCLSWNEGIWSWLWLPLISAFFPSLYTPAIKGYAEKDKNWFMLSSPSPWDYTKYSISDDDAFSDKAWCIPALAVCRLTLIHEKRAVRFNAAPCTGWLISAQSLCSYMCEPYIL